ncbi:MAG: dihydroorotate dehydrogenase electron transfer subunit [Streptococcus salivarius]
MILVEDLTIVSQREIAPRIFEMVLKGEMVADMQVGQFVHLKVPDPSKLLRRPISISEIDYDKKEATIVYRVEREGTAILSKMVAGQTIDTMGPQGNGFDISVIEAGQKALLVGGGIGVPPLVETAKQLKAKGVEVVSVIGFANKDAVILEDKLRACGDVYVTTMTVHTVSRVTFRQLLILLTDSRCRLQSGAPGMLKHVDSKFENHPHAYVSMEARMACGMGACYACVVHVKGERCSKIFVFVRRASLPTGKVISLGRLPCQR